MSSLTPQSLRRKLSILEYPNHASFNVNNISEVCVVSLWLEEGKIRYYDVSGRQNLRTNVNTPVKFFTLLITYLQELECPYYIFSVLNDFVTSESIDAPPSGVLTPVVEWLIARAIQAEYQEKAAFYQQHASAAKSILQQDTAITTPISNTQSKIRPEMNDDENTSELDAQVNTNSFLQLAWKEFIPLCIQLSLPPPPGLDSGSLQEKYEYVLHADAETLTVSLSDIVYSYFMEISRRISQDIPLFIKVLETDVSQTVVRSTLNNSAPATNSGVGVVENNTISTLKNQQYAAKNPPPTLEQLKTMDIVTFQKSSTLHETIDAVEYRKDTIEYAKKYANIQTGNEKVDVLVGILKALYNYDLKTLQLEVNRVISTAQDLTANFSVKG